MRTVRPSCRFAALFLLCLFSLPLFAQYTDRAALNDLGGPQEFARRRVELARQVQKGYILLFARTDLPESAHYREDNDFFYLTGISDPGAAVLIKAPEGQTVLFEPLQSLPARQVYGPNLLSLSPAEREQLGFKEVEGIGELPARLSRLLWEGTYDLWLRRSFSERADRSRMEAGIDRAIVGSELNPAHQGLESARKVAELFPMLPQHDVTPSLDAMRNLKTPAEQAVLRRNGKLSAEGIRRAIGRAHPGMYEYQVEAEANYVFANGGADGYAYPAIVGSGPNCTVSHYFGGRRRMEANDLVVFDYAADQDHVTMDITPTFNVSGKFTPEQAKWYAVQLEAEKAVIAALRPGNTYEQAAEAGKAIYEKAGIGEQWHTFPGHYVGLATHDGIGPAGPIRSGQVVAVEPIIEFPDRHLHIRVEDTVLITDVGPEVLTSGVPKELAEVERLVGSEK